MITRFHGIDKHKKYSTISVLNRKGEEVDFRQKCYDLKEYIENLYWFTGNWTKRYAEVR